MLSGCPYDHGQRKLPPGNAGDEDLIREIETALSENHVSEQLLRESRELLDVAYAKVKQLHMSDSIPIEIQDIRKHFLDRILERLVGEPGLVPDTYQQTRNGIKTMMDVLISMAVSEDCPREIKEIKKIVKTWMARLRLDVFIQDPDPSLVLAHTYRLIGYLLSEPGRRSLFSIEKGKRVCPGLLTPNGRLLVDTIIDMAWGSFSWDFDGQKLIYHELTPEKVNDHEVHVIKVSL